ncbi:hypothetical protein HAZT_HAZT007222 [Hyalella azteca]|uniref:Innexin n=1 Tax=Hyalella azteca TaxID=294128 RepID=A0A6A0H6V6_HYAAZ|nr:hypothetical protein HAZT_HAZT007222 [Hyalella azteca]
MSDVFGSIRGLLKIDSVSIDNYVFRLHYKATMFLLVAFSLLVTQKQYFGDPIDCLVDKIPPYLMDTYCWIHSTYTIPDLGNKTVGKDIPHPGIASPALIKEGSEVRYHKYYQWVTLMLYFQAILFYLPRYIWKVWEGGKMKLLSSGVNTVIIDQEDKQVRLEALLSYFNSNLHGHKFYAVKYVLCEIANFANVIGQIYFTDRFLGYQFTTYGTDVLFVSEKEMGTRHDTMDAIFPKVRSSIESHDALCVLPLNIINEKIYIFLWFWFIIVAAISGIGLIYRLVTFHKRVRTRIFKSICCYNEEKIDVEIVAHKCDYGDWFLLRRLSKNVDAFFFRDFVKEFAARLDGRQYME